MTLGERIQALRKDGGLSQEELGEKLGVARQSVSKWESDATIPELDKLIAMSKLFGISVGALLGLEESEGVDHELTDRELAALETIAQRLTPAKEADRGEEPRKKRRWPKVVAVGLVIVAGLFLVGRISDLENQLANLQFNVSNMQNTVSREIGSIGTQVRDILEAQNSVVAGKNYEVVDMDLINNMVTFALTATPREYKEGMKAVFSATGADFKTVEVPGNLGAGQNFTAELTCPLTDDITLWVGFTEDGATVTQQMGQERNLLSYTRTQVYGRLNWTITFTGPNSPGKLTDATVHVGQSGMGQYKTREEGNQENRLVKGTLRLWNGDALFWSQEYEFLDQSFYDNVSIPAEELDLTPGGRVILSLLYTDSAGREVEEYLDGFVIKEDGKPQSMGYAEGLEYPWEK